MVIETALGFVAVGVFVVWAVRDGGYAPEEWLPGGLLSLGLLCTLLASADVRARLYAQRTPLLLFGLYVGWSYASIAWAQVQGDAVDGANRTLVYWLLFALFCGLGVGRRATALVLAWGVAIAVAGVVSLAEAATATRPMGHFVLGRLAAPISYPDADAALFLSACLPLLVLASRPSARPALRAATGATAVVLADLAVLCQSRGSAIVLPLALVLYLVAARGKLRALLHVFVLMAAAAPAVSALLAVERAVVAGAGWPGAVRHACLWIGADALLGALAFGLIALLEPRLRLEPRTRAAIGRTLLIAAAAGILAAAGLAVAFAHPVSRAETAWHNFTTNQRPASETSHFAAGLGTSRYDVWRIALRQFAAHPVTGVGADNYLVGYLRDRRTRAVSRYPQSIEFRVLSETGIVGALLFFGFLLVALPRAWRAARRALRPELALACLAGSGYWLLHSSVDWFWEFPALTGPGLALLAIAGAPLVAERQPARVPRRRRDHVLITAVAALAALAAAAALAVPWAAVRMTDEAVGAGPGRHAWSVLRSAAALNPLSEQPALAEASLAASAGEPARESQAFRSALERNPYDWYAYLMLGIIAGRQHHPARARADLAHAHRLSPHDNLVYYAQKRQQANEPMSQSQVASILRYMSSELRGARQH